jgi:zinc transport system permease protein
VLESFLLKPFFAVILVAISCSLLGVFVLWKRLFYFGDAMSHSILLGLAIGSFFAADQILILMCFAVVFALMTNFLSQNRYASKGLIVAILSYFCISSAFIIDDIFPGNVNFHSYIFGDILAVGNLEIILLALIATIIIFYSIFALRKILLINLNSDLAKIAGIKTEIWNLSFLILLSLTVALCVQIVGVFLMTALLVLPATIARIFSVSAKQMMGLSAILGITISGTSFQIASHYDLKVGSTIIAIFCIIFFMGLCFKKAKS